MAGYRLSARARRDIDELYEYSIDRFGLAVAQAYFNGLHDVFELLGANPMMGRSVDHLRAGLRCFVHQRHSIYYRVDDRGPAIQRVLHVARDPLRAFR